MINYISPIVIDGPYVAESSLWVSKVGPSSSEMRCDLDIRSNTTEMGHKDGSYVLPMGLAVSVSLFDDVDDESMRERRMEARMTVYGSVSVTDQVEADPDQVEDNLRLNATSMFYSFIKAQIESQTSMSPMKRFTIPAIDPQRLMELICSNPDDQP